MKYFPRYYEMVEKAIENAPFKGSPANVYDPLNYILSLGGKRMRPIALLMGCEMFGGNTTTAIPAALAVEYFHNFSLIHDDIMDRANLRRGKATVHTRWNLPVGILSGDLLLIKSYQQLEHYEPELQAKLIKEFNTGSILVCEGQQYDMDFASQEDVRIDDYLGMIQYKTAALLAASLKMGALIAGAKQEAANELYQIGMEAGTAFQLADDLLDAFPVSDKFGKKAGGDILENKKTWLYLYALQQHQGTNEYQQLIQYYQSNYQGSEAEKIEAVLQIFKMAGADNACKEESEKWYDKAYARLQALSLTAASKEPLFEMMEMLRERSF